MDSPPSYLSCSDSGCLSTLNIEARTCNDPRSADLEHAAGARTGRGVEKQAGMAPSCFGAAAGLQFASFGSESIAGGSRVFQGSYWGLIEHSLIAVLPMLITCHLMLANFLMFRCYQPVGPLVSFRA